MTLRISGAGKLPPFAAALVDLDGTLCETERVLYAAWCVLVQRAGFDFRTFGYANIIGRPDLDCAAIVAKHFGIEREPAEWYEEYREISFAMMDKDLELRPGVQEFLDTVRRHKAKLALVTSATLEHARKSLDKFGLYDKFDVHVTAETPGLTARKPDPAPYLLAAELLGVDPKRCAAFEDSPAGVESALAAGCFTYGIPHQHSVSSGLMRASVILHSLSAFNDDRVIRDFVRRPRS